MALRVGVIGLGVGEQHVIGWDKDPRADVTALCDIDAAKLEEVSARHPGKRQTAVPADILDDPEIDAVSIASYDDAHHEQVVRALANGKHVFCEKPLCLSETELNEIAEALSRAPDLCLSSNLILRMSPRFRDLRSRISDGRLGQVFHVEGDYNYGRLHKLTDGWRGRIPDYSVTKGGGVHMVDLLQWLSRQRVTEVSAYATNLTSGGAESPQVHTAVALLHFDNGLVGKVASNFACVHPHFHRLMIYGTNATFENRMGDAILYSSRDPLEEPQYLDTEYPGVTKGGLISSFIDEISGSGRPEVSAFDSLHCMAVCIAIDESIRTGKCTRVAMPEMPRNKQD